MIHEQGACGLGGNKPLLHWRVSLVDWPLWSLMKIENPLNVLRNEAGERDYCVLDLFFFKLQSCF